jgi:hypothetical protein
MLDFTTSSTKLGGANPDRLRILRSGPGRIRAAWSPSNKLRPGPKRNTRRTHPGRRTRPPRWNRRPALGHDACFPALHIPNPSRIPLLVKSDVASPPGLRGPLRPGAMGCPNPESLHREPTRLPQLEVQPYLPDHTALAIRTRIHKAHMPMAERSSTPDRHSDPLRTHQLDGSKQPQVKAEITPAEPYFPRYCICNGKPVVTHATSEP